MPVYQIPDEHFLFPHPSLANADGLIGIGADLHPQRLLLAYQNGIFPWYSAGEPVHWWCLTPRLILFPSKIKIAKSMRPYLKEGRFQYSFDKEFISVMLNCKTVDRKEQKGSWIHQDILDAFMALHEQGFAHSVEVWENAELVGGLYGLALGKMFCGESMFAKKPNASKLALIQLSKFLLANGYNFIDCQQDTSHLRSMGAELVQKSEFFQMLEDNKAYPLNSQSWKN